MLFVSHDRRFLAGPVQPRAGTGAARGVIPTAALLEYVARSGHEAPGLRA